MGANVPSWVTPVAWTWIALCLASAGVLALRRRPSDPQGVVWLATALYLGPLALLLHARSERRHRGHEYDRSAEVDRVLPGGAASALAHVVGVPLVVLSGLTIAGTDLWVMILVIGVVAIALLAAYERSAGAVPPGAALLVAAVTVLAFDVGMGGWMLLLHYGQAMPPATDGSFWFLMQVGVVLGLATGWPAARWAAERWPGTDAQPVART